MLLVIAVSIYEYYNSQHFIMITTVALAFCPLPD